MPDTPQTLRPATADEFEQAPAHDLRFDGRKAFKVSGEMMARITAGRLAERHRGGRMGDVSGASYGTPVHFNWTGRVEQALRQPGLVVTKAPPASNHSDAGHYDPAQRAKAAGRARKLSAAAAGQQPA